MAAPARFSKEAPKRGRWNQHMSVLVGRSTVSSLFGSPPYNQVWQGCLLFQRYIIIARKEQKHTKKRGIHHDIRIVVGKLMVNS